MGLDTVELVMNVEERFQTRCFDGDLEKVQTIGDLHQLLMERIQINSSDLCLTSSMFYAIRQILIDTYDIDRVDVRPGSSLNSLIPQTERFKFWQTVEQELSCDLLPLKRSKIFQWHGDRFPETLITVGNLARECCDRHAITNEFQSEDEELVWTEICQIVSEVALVEPQNLRPETHFVYDLGLS